ncbi:MAG: group 1 glycosyl transferase [Acidobacteria bacterium OLB17]|nr:MAG: group 1 glycosyl transferase [Acidobacteria bacterium OLB17]MCZ2390305.1 glycosyltransferase [Acidobacteriota bacterium]
MPDRPKRIVRVIARLNVGGPARHVVWLTRSLVPPEFESTLIAGTVPEGEEDMSYFADENGVRPIFIKELSRELSPKDALCVLKLFREFRSLRPDIIHTHTAKAGAVGRTAAFLYKYLTPGTLVGRPRRVRRVHTFHGHVFHSYYGRAKTRLFILIERLLAHATDRIVVISEQQLEEIAGKFRIGRREQFAVIPLGIEPIEHGGKRSELREEFHIPAGRLLAGFVGRLTEIKNLDLLLDAAAICRKENAPVHFLIVGDGHLRESLERRAAELNLTNLTFTGNHKEIAPILAELDIFVLTSKNEGTPLSMIEAMAAGVPVVSTAVGGVVDLAGEVTESREGFDVASRAILIRSNDPADLKKGLLYLVKSEKVRETLSLNALHHVDEKYSVARLVKDIVQLYNDIG